MNLTSRWVRVAAVAAACAAALAILDRLAAPPADSPGPASVSGGLFAGDVRPLNRWGFRDYDYAEAKAPGVFRIVAIGGPETYGAGVNFDDAWPKKLERYLNLYPAAKPGRRYQVLNLGREEATPSGQIDILESFGPRLAPDLVILGFELDAADDPAVRARFLPPGGLAPATGAGSSLPARAFFGHTGIGRRLAAGVGRARAIRARTELVERLHGPEAGGAGVARRTFDRLRDFRERAGAPVAVVVIPTAGVPLDGRYPFAGIHESLGRAAGDSGLPMLDLLPGFRDLREGILETGPHDLPRRSDQGQRIAAEMLFAFLVDRGLLGPSAEVAPRYGVPLPTPYQPAPAGSEVSP